jgi:hypothetical protein
MVALFTGHEEVLRVEVAGEGHIEEKEDGQSLLVKITGKRKGSGPQWRRASRAVLKSGLNLLYLKHGADVALDPFHDPLRKAIMGIHMRDTY